jgi:hypothetical protein
MRQGWGFAFWDLCDPLKLFRNVDLEISVIVMRNQTKQIPMIGHSLTLFLG